MDCSPPGSSVHGILQASVLEWLTISYSRGSFQPGDLTHVSCISCIANVFFTIEPPGKPGRALTSIKIESSLSSMFACLLIFKQVQAWRNHHEILENSLVHISDPYKNISEVCPTLKLFLLELNEMLTREWWAGKKKISKQLNKQKIQISVRERDQDKGKLTFLVTLIKYFNDFVFPFPHQHRVLLIINT